MGLEVLVMVEDLGVGGGKMFVMPQQSLLEALKKFQPFSELMRRLLKSQTLGLTLSLATDTGG